MLQSELLVVATQMCEVRWAPESGQPAMQSNSVTELQGTPLYKAVCLSNTPYMVLNSLVRSRTHATLADCLTKLGSMQSIFPLAGMSSGMYFLI